MLEKADDIRTFYENDFLPNPSQIAQIELEVNPDFIYADGESTAIVQCHLIDYFGNPFAGKLITFEADEGDITESVITDSLGFATAEFFTSSEPESGFSLITAYSTDADYGNEESNIEINVLPANLSGNPNVPIPHDLIINYDNNTISIDWVSEVLLESNFNFNVYYNFLIYKNNEQYSMIEGMPQLNQRDSYWSRDSLYLFYVNDYFDFYSPQLPIISEYRIIWAEFDYESTCYCANSFSSDACVEGEIYCTEHLFAESITNFHVQKKLGNSGNEEDWVEIPFGFWDIVPNGTPDGIFNYSVYESDIILFLDGEDESGIRPSWQFTLINPLVDDSLHVYNQPSSGDTAFVSTRYYFDENETDENLNCYEISMFFPFTSNSDYFLPGTESIRSEEICIVTDYIPGDINLDGMIDVLDVVTIVSIILGDDPPLGYQIDIGDISGDNQLDILDIVMIIDIILS